MQDDFTSPSPATPLDKPTVLIVDDTPANLDLLARVLEEKGYDVLAAASGETALRVAAAAKPLIALLDVMMPGLDGYELCRRLKADPFTSHLPVIFISARDEIQSVVTGFEAGGVDYILKPFQPQEVLARVGAQVRLAQLTQQLASQNAALQAAMEASQREADRRVRAEDALQTADGRLSVLSAREAQRWDVDGFVGKSRTLAKILADVRRVGNFGSVNVLITGESGTGKELIARAIHSGSPRASGPFIPVNGVAIPQDLAESMFFGHVRGAFTGATADRKGYFELADGGTLFLDEIGDMPVTLQAKLLRVLEDGRITPVGGSKEKRVDVRVVAATNANLHRQIASGAFRQDVYFRLAQFCVELPPLRDRPEDIPLLAEHFKRLFAREMGLEPPPIQSSVLRLLAAHTFPGNVRELKNIIERCLIESGGEAISEAHLQVALPRTVLTGPPASVEPPLIATVQDEKFAAVGADQMPLNLDEAEAILIKRALTESKGNVAEAARLLGVNRTRIYRRLQGSGPLSPVTRGED